MKLKFAYPHIRSFPLIVLPIVLLVTSFSAQAEIDLSGTYTGVQFADNTDRFVDSSGIATEYNHGHIKAKYGWILNDSLSFEGHLGITSNSDERAGILTYGAYIRPNIDFGKFKLYGLLGLGGTYNYDDKLKDHSESGGSYGVGVEIFGSKDLAITLEYVSILDKSVNGGDLTFDTLGIGFTYYFTEDKSYFNKNRNKIKSIRY
jgi:opacity protein-like surface antigen